MINKNPHTHSQTDFESSSLWSFNLCSGLLKRLLKENRYYEESIGDLEEVLYKMNAQQSPIRRLHLETLRRTFYLLISALKIKDESDIENFPSDLRTVSTASTVVDKKIEEARQIEEARRRLWTARLNFNMELIWNWVVGGTVKRTKDF